MSEYPIVECPRCGYEIRIAVPLAPIEPIANSQKDIDELAELRARLAAAEQRAEQAEKQIEMFFRQPEATAPNGICKWCEKPRGGHGNNKCYCIPVIREIKDELESEARWADEYKRERDAMQAVVDAARKELIELRAWREQNTPRDAYIDYLLSERKKLSDRLAVFELFSAVMHSKYHGECDIGDCTYSDCQKLTSDLSALAALDAVQKG